MIALDATPSLAETSTTTGLGAMTSGPFAPVGGYGKGDGFRFSARTCLAILPLLDESTLDSEISMLEKYTLSPGLAPSFRPRGVEGKRDYLMHHLCSTLCVETDKITQNFDLLRDSISDAIRSQQPDHVTHCTPRPIDSTILTAHTTRGDGKLPEPVRVADFNFCEILLDDVLATCDFTHLSAGLSGHRQVVYFGSQPYSYGKYAKHDAQLYPTSPFFDRFFKEISVVDPNFTVENFSCLATLYKDGKSYIPSHCDNEDSIVAESNIYTISFGVSRTLHFTNEKGRIRPVAVKLDHGSVNIMTRASQDFWKHEIRPEREVEGQRVSLTFRHLKSPGDVPTPQQTQQTAPAHSEAEPEPLRRTLLLTDSILSATPPHLLAATNHQCLKKMSYRFENLFDYEDEFEYTDQVIISCGVNDLHKYNHTAQSLFELSGSRLEYHCKANPNTQFVFNSVLLTQNIPWLNNEINQFNELMYTLCSALQNLHYFDSHDVLKRAKLQEVYFPWKKDSRYGNGIHVVFGARKVIVSELARYIKSIARSRAVRFQGTRYNTG